jgi:hypothetical protein
MREFRSRLFNRIVPTVKNIGLWGPKIRKVYSDMGIIGFADVDTVELDERRCYRPPSARAAGSAI